MIKLDFETYQKRLAHEHGLTRFPQQHYYEGSELFILFFKSKEKWEYYTVVFKQDLKESELKNEIEFEEFKQELENSGLENEKDIENFKLKLKGSNSKEERYIEDFKLRYCSNIIRVLELNSTYDEVWRNAPNFIEVPFKDEEYKKEYIIETLLKKSIDIIDANEIIEESKDYSEFLEKLFNSFKIKVINGLKSLDLEKNFKVSKEFPDFLKTLFNTVNTVLFAKIVKKYIKGDFQEGIKSTEKELDVNLPFNDRMELKIKQLYQQQLNGYTINGKLWKGIKGVTREIQFQTIKTVQDGISENKSLNEVQKEIEKIFDKFEGFRSKAIARTETNRILNEGLLLGYKEAGIQLDIDLGKTIDTNTDSNTSPICLRMVAKYRNKVIGLDEEFIDDEGEGATMFSFLTPPFNVSCRRRIVSKRMKLDTK